MEHKNGTLYMIAGSHCSEY